MTSRRDVLVAALAAWPVSAARAQAPAEPLMFAAASLQTALEAVARQYRQDRGRGVRFSFAASSVLARQIEQGAPASAYASADEQWMDYLAERRLIVPATRRALLGNRLVLVVPQQDARTLDLRPGLDLARWIGVRERWVTGDPASVPVGRYAQQALVWLKAWEPLAPRLVRAENVRVALALVERGEAAAGIVYATDAALSTRVRVAAEFPPEAHAPIRYPFAVTTAHDAPAAREWLAYLATPTATRVFQSYGFSTLAA